MKLLNVMDRATIRLLAENCRVESFAPDLKKKLQEIYDTKAAKVHHFFITVFNSGNLNSIYQVQIGWIEVCGISW